MAYPIDYTNFICSNQNFSIYTILDTLSFNSKKDIYIKFVDGNNPILNIYTNDVLITSLVGVLTSFEHIYIFSLVIPALNSIDVVSNKVWTKGTYLLEFTDVSTTSKYYESIVIDSSEDSTVIPARIIL